MGAPDLADRLRNHAYSYPDRRQRRRYILIVGLLLVPLGIIGYIDDTNVINRDTDFATFIRSLGSVMGSRGITTGDALQEVDKKSLPHLEPFIDSVSSRQNLGLDETGSWRKFIGETGSYLVYKYEHLP